MLEPNLNAFPLPSQKVGGVTGKKTEAASELGGKIISEAQRSPKSHQDSFKQINARTTRSGLLSGNALQEHGRTYGLTI